jgi:hypothetical protein
MASRKKVLLKVKPSPLSRLIRSVAADAAGSSSLVPFPPILPLTPFSLVRLRSSSSEIAGMSLSHPSCHGLVRPLPDSLRLSPIAPAAGRTRSLPLLAFPLPRLYPLSLRR